VHLRAADGRTAGLAGTKDLVDGHAEGRRPHGIEPLGKLLRSAARRIGLARTREVDHLPGAEMLCDLDRRTEEQRGREREVARGDHADLARPCERVELVVVGGGETARADDDVDAVRDRREDVVLHCRRMRVVDEHVGGDGSERLRDRRVARRVGARDTGDELQIGRGLDRGCDGATGPAGYAGDADADRAIGHRARSGGHPECDLVLRDRRAPSGGVAGGHRVQCRVAARIVVVVVEEQDHERLLGFGIVKDDDLLCRDVSGALVALHVALHLGHPFAVDTVERHDTCEGHDFLLVES
jgi:hypothetical protein